MKIIIAGPPHSGKSVLLASLKELLPADSFETVRVNKDGEGYWSNNENKAQTEAARIKELYDEEFIEERCSLIEKMEKPIVLVDIGGRLYPDKMKIFKTCDSFIVLSADNNHLYEWKEFGEYWGAKVIALLNSVLTEETDYTVQDKITKDKSGFPLEGILHNLARGTYHTLSPVIQRLADRIIIDSGYKKSENTDQSVINFYKIAEKIGCIKKRKVQNIEISYGMKFVSEKTLDLYNCIDELPLRDSYILDGARANWVSLLSVEILKKKGCRHIKIYDTETGDNVELKELNKNQAAENFKVKEDNSGVYIELSENRHFEVSELESIVIPEIDETKELFISGRMPLWLFDSISISYSNNEKYVYQPGNGYFCYKSKIKEKLGSCVN